MVHKSVAKKLGLSSPEDPLRIKWTNDMCCDENESRRVSMEIDGGEKGKRFHLQNARTVSRMSLPCQS
ncbi:unnamed protein product, partial [Allacma fusca]